MIENLPRPYPKVLGRVRRGLAKAIRSAKEGDKAEASTLIEAEVKVMKDNIYAYGFLDSILGEYPADLLHIVEALRRA